MNPDNNGKVPTVTINIPHGISSPAIYIHLPLTRDVAVDLAKTIMEEYHNIANDATQPNPPYRKPPRQKTDPTPPRGGK